MIDVDNRIQSALATGIVNKIYMSGRDKVMLPYPCFEVNARFESGMSGGPVFSENNGVIGMITTSMHTDKEDEYVSWCSFIWAALGIEVTTNIDGCLIKCLLKDFVDVGKIIMDESKDYITFNRIGDKVDISLDLSKLKK
jgi:hypothetical protein